MQLLQRLDVSRRARAAGIHLLISAAVALLAGGVVFGLWYPGIFRLVAGGRDLFLLITTVDVVLGPLLTFAVFNLKKGWPHLRRDLIIIGLIQLTALIYGLHTVYGARPIATVFEVDRFRVLTAGKVYLPDLPKARVEFRELPLMGPWMLGTRAPQRGVESNNALFMALEYGIDRYQRPLFWQPYADSITEVLSRARPVSLLLSQYPEITSGVRAAMKARKANEDSVKFLPFIGRGGDWVVLINDRGELIHYVQVDGFF